MKRDNFIIRLCAVYILFGGVFGSYTVSAQQPSDIRSIVEHLASEKMGGRYPGTQGDSLTTAYIAEQFRSIGLQPVNGSYFQPFEYPADQRIGSNNSLSIDSKTLELNKDFQPLNFSASAISDSEIVYVGYGLEVESDSLKWSDYSGMEVTGKTVLMLRGLPDDGRLRRAAAHRSGDRDKTLNAQDKGALAVIIINPSHDTIDRFYSAARDFPVSIPAVQMKRETAEDILGREFLLSRESGGDAMRGMEGMPMHISMQSKQANETIHTAHMTVNIEQKFTSSNNVWAALPSTNSYGRGRYIIIGAHHDHLGMGGHGSGSRTPDSLAVHYGADDNASGVAGLIDMASRFNDKGSSMNILFAAFGAEEKGLVGSKYMADNLPVPKDSIAVMINFDMIGRLRDGNLTIGGTGTAAEFDTLLDELQDFPGLNLGRSPQGHGPSDHASFYAKDIPVLFISTGGTMEYHTPYDTFETINFEGMETVIDFTETLIRKIADHPGRLTFQETGTPSSGHMQMRFKVTLGIMPDVVGTVSDGLRADIVVKDKPAHRAGLRAGDVIIEMDGKPVNNIEDYMTRLGDLQPDRIVMLKIRREGEIIEIPVEI